MLVMEQRGCEFSWPEEESSTLSVIVDGETLKFGICEIFNAKPHVLTRAEEKKSHYLAPRWDYQLTGRLRHFSWGKIPYASEGRKTWSDGRYQRLEHSLESLVLGLRVATATTKKNRLKREEEGRREEERKQKEEDEKVAIEQERKARFIGGLMLDWQQSRSLRAFAKAMGEAADRLKLSDQEKNDLQQVVDWTCDYAKSLDPISNLPDSVEEFVHPERQYDWLEEGE
jgi:hypothetical protein